MKKVFKKLIAPLILMAVFIVPFVAFGQDPVPVDPGADVGSFFELLWGKLQSSEWLIAFGLGLVGLVQLMKVALPWVAGALGWDSFKEKLQSKWGKIIMSAGTALLLTAGTALAAGQGLSLSLVTTALAAAWAASGGWENIKDLLALLSPKEEEE